jgi:hypothetical protein
MKLAIMQPYFMPYIGYYQLINAVDVFVIYDNIEFTKKGWINRNRILMNGKDEYITIPLKKGSDFLHVNQRFLSDTSLGEMKRTLNKIGELYRKAPHYAETMALLNDIFLSEEKNLFEFIKQSILKTLFFLDIQTPIVNSSYIPIQHHLKSEEKVLAICKNLQAQTYINPIGGLTLYSHTAFKQNQIKLQFIKSNLFQYPQFSNEFVQWLSIIDVLMFNGVDKVKQIINTEFQLIENESI